ncbi:MAG TPA: SDR family NAD(P)-dependent oxidoreductase [Lacisediminihabitans sp.]|uniref:SDR family NAD(P)-dependent oxidoreductase n=1 Tax=Lacisediminihabitans sp. TaxID=2787631 RepID=UPI002EDA8757
MTANQAPVPAKDSLDGRTIVITGSSSGLGRAAAIELGRRGATVAVVGRNPERTAEAAHLAGGTAFVADFDHLDQVRGLADALLSRYERIDVLANNAGGLMTSRQVTADGFERTFQSNHLAPFLLTNLLLERITAGGGRVLSTASSSNTIARLDFNDLNFERLPWRGGWQAYGTTKLETILFIKELARRTAGTGLDAYSFHPGYVASNFGAEIAIMKFAQAISVGRLGLSPERGAEPLIVLAQAADVGAPSGTYFSRLHPNGRTQRIANDPAAARTLWEKSAELVGL